MEILAAKHTDAQSDDAIQKQTDCTRDGSTQNKHCKRNDISMQQNSSSMPLKGLVSFGSTVGHFTQTDLLSVGENSSQAEVSHSHSFTETPSFDDSRSLPVPEVLAIQIDYFLWNYAKANAAQMASNPIHRTTTIFY